MNRLAYFVPLLLLGVLAVYFAAGLGRDPRTLDSVLLNQKVPIFSLPAIEGTSKGLSNADLGSEVILVNIFGSWCVACRIEHPFLMELKEKNVVPIYGIDWREPDRKAGPRWLKKYGNPYTRIGDDPQSRGAIAFGVTGAPETFFVDKKGVIRFKHIGPITAQNWNDTLKPVLDKLRKE
jgi:cytochrome c biogenesis protein CcmG, thiol:disulfide interchange protein DsbE